MSSVRCGWVASRVGRYLVDPGSEAFVAGRLAWWKSWAIRGFSSASETVPAAGTVAPGVALFPPNRLRFHYENVLRNDLLAKFDYNNVMEVPRVTAVVVVPRAPLDCEKAARVALEVVCGQKFLPIKSKDPALKVRRSKYEPKRNLRKVVPVARTTLRGDLMYNFLEKLVSVTSFHDYSSNIQSHCVQLRVGSQLLRLFPEILNHIEMFDQIRGVNVTVVTSARTREEAASLWSGFLHREK